LKQDSTFVWNHFDGQSTTSAWALQFKDIATQKKFQEAMATAMWEVSNKQSWLRNSSDQRKYFLDSFNEDVDMPDQSDEEEEVDEDSGAIL
jgi:hypothetical protein